MRFESTCDEALHEPAAARGRRLRQNGRGGDCAVCCRQGGPPGRADGADGDLGGSAYAVAAEDVCSCRHQVALLTGSLTERRRREVLAGLQMGVIDVVVGTHAIIQDDVFFRSLGLVVTDEQHRFGVNQRSVLRRKGLEPGRAHDDGDADPAYAGDYSVRRYGRVDAAGTAAWTQAD